MITKTKVEKLYRSRLTAELGYDSHLEITRLKCIHPKALSDLYMKNFSLDFHRHVFEDKLKIADAVTSEMFDEMGVRYDN